MLSALGLGIAFIAAAWMQDAYRQQRWTEIANAEDPLLSVGASKWLALFWCTAVVVAGAVVAFGEIARWFTKRPLVPRSGRGQLLLWVGASSSCVFGAWALGAWLYARDRERSWTGELPLLSLEVWVEGGRWLALATIASGIMIGVRLARRT